MSRVRSKTLATWLALLGGAFGLHRFYLHGWRDAVGWLYPLPTLLGLAGMQRMRAFGQDDRVAWVLIPLLGLALSAAMLTAIVYGLTSDDKWAARHRQPLQATGWAPVLGVIAALLIGASVLMGTVAFSGQRFFEWQLAPSADKP
jgi:TM2 domain